MEKTTMLTDKELDQVSGGAGGTRDMGYRTVSNLKESYLPLRSRPYYSDNNEIGELYNGDTVRITDSSLIYSSDGHQYYHVYDPKSRQSGYANAAFLRKQS